MIRVTWRNRSLLLVGAERLKEAVENWLSPKVVGSWSEVEAAPLVCVPPPGAQSWDKRLPLEPVVGYINKTWLSATGLCLAISEDLEELEVIVSIRVGSGKVEVEGLRKGTKLAALRRFGPMVDFIHHNPENGQWNSCYVPVAWLRPPEGRVS